MRRAVALDCKLECNAWDGSVVLEATDLSSEGLWVETPYALSEGEEVVVSFDLPGPELGCVWAVAEVARVGLWRRRDDERPSGMGLVFTYCSEDDRRRLRSALEGKPPPLPAEALSAAVPPPLPWIRSVEANGSAAERGVAARAATLDDALPAVLDWMLASE